MFIAKQRFRMRKTNVEKRLSKKKKIMINIKFDKSFEQRNEQHFFKNSIFEIKRESN